ncbi:MAG: hypothetical protein HY313_08030 [Acidobacteria bacterium]|nr:hypothetical protein [Acidobacteriota bacterium]
MSVPNHLTDKSSFLASNAEIAYRDASLLLSWWKEKQANGTLKTFLAGVPDSPSLQVECFYDTFVLHGKQTALMGCVWKSQYPRNRSAEISLPLTLESFIQTQFLDCCRWAHPDTLPGGFGFIPLQYKMRATGEYGVFTKKEPSLDLSQIGKDYEWVILEAVVHDFFRNMPRFNFGPKILSRLPKMASYVLVHRDYFSPLNPSLEGAKDECCFGYSFLPCPVVQSVFGYGPGQFTAAVKQFQFALLENGNIGIKMFFLVCPRSEKILSLRGFDPIYSSIHLLNALTFGVFNLKRRVHDRVDSFSLAMHAKIYQNLLDGMKEVWENQNWIERNLQSSPLNVVTSLSGNSPESQ